MLRTETCFTLRARKPIPLIVVVELLALLDAQERPPYLYKLDYAFRACV